MSCQLQGSYNFGTDIEVDVACRNASTGSLANARFGVVNCRAFGGGEWADFST